MMGTVARVRGDDGGAAKRAAKFGLEMAGMGL